MTSNKFAFSNKFMRFVEEFCSTIFIVGLKEAYQTKYMVIRIMWILCILSSIVMTLCFMTVIISDYRSEPTSTKVLQITITILIASFCK